MQPKVSVIIPVYNVERYIQRCLDSVVNQTLDNIQIILVNDGSKDSSGKICLEYAEKYDNISYYFQENAGSAAARNAGLDHAEGEYIGFVDADDWIEPDMYRELYDAAKGNSDADIVMCRVFEDECPGSKDYIFLREGYFSRDQIKEEIIPYMLPSVMPAGNFRSIRWSNVIRLYRRSLIENNHIRSCEGVSNCEDLGFLAECTLKASGYYYLPKSLYHNVVNVASQSRNYVANMWPRTRKLIADMYRYIGPCRNVALEKAFDVCIFYFCTMNLRNEMRLNARSARIEKIREVVMDPLCIEAVGRISHDGMNAEYTAIYGYVKNQDPEGLERYLTRLAWKKKHVTPVLDKLFRNRTLKTLYLKLRGK